MRRSAGAFFRVLALFYEGEASLRKGQNLLYLQSISPKVLLLTGFAKRKNKMHFLAKNISKSY